MTSPWSGAVSWLLAATAAVALAVAAPNETAVMGQVPAFMARSLSQQAVVVPGGLPAERTLALIAFRSSQQEHIDGWVQGLNLKAEPSISWLRMPVLDDPGSEAARGAIESRLLRKYPSDAERARLVPVFTNREHFVRAAGLAGTDQVYAVVLNRQGEVLARAGGAFDADKAGNLRETLLTAGLPCQAAIYCSTGASPSVK